MAMTVTSRGTGSSNTGGQTTLVATPASNIAVGSTAVLCVAYDNSGTNGADPISATVDSKGNVWGNYRAALNDPGAASAGMVGRMVEARVMVSGGLTTGDTITMSFSATTVARAWALYEVTADDGKYATEFDSAAASQTSATPSITSNSIGSGGVIIACVAREANGTRTADGDATNGSWTNAQHVGVGTTTGGAEIICESKIVSATATQTYNPTFGGASADGVNMWKYLDQVVREAVTMRPIYTQILPQ